MFDKIKATWNFWNNYGKETSKDLPSNLISDNIPDYVQDLDDIQQDGTELESKDISVIHSMNSTISYSINIPAHLPRKDSSLFISSRKKLIEELDTPCWICGSKENRQAHHFFIEYSLCNACDWEKLKLDHLDFPNWDKMDFNNPDTFYIFVDDLYNLRSLCQNHHTGNNKGNYGYGIHNLPYPLWTFQKYAKSSFQFLNPKI